MHLDCVLADGARLSDEGFLHMPLAMINVVVKYEVCIESLASGKWASKFFVVGLSASASAIDDWHLWTVLLTESKRWWHGAGVTIWEAGWDVGAGALVAGGTHVFECVGEKRREEESETDGVAGGANLVTCKDGVRVDGGVCNDLV